MGKGEGDKVGRGQQFIQTVIGEDLVKTGNWSGHSAFKTDGISAHGLAVGGKSSANVACSYHQNGGAK